MIAAVTYLSRDPKKRDASLSIGSIVIAIALTSAMLLSLIPGGARTRAVVSFWFKCLGKFQANSRSANIVMPSVAQLLKGDAGFVIS